MKKLILGLMVLMFAVVPFVSAAHYVVGTVNGNGNGKTVTLYNPVMGISNNITDIVGPTGNSGVDNIYMIDVEMLYSCDIGDEVRVTLGGSDDYVSVKITGAGYDVAPNLTVTQIVIPPTPVNITNTTIPIVNVTNSTIKNTTVVNTTVIVPVIVNVTPVLGKHEIVKPIKPVVKPIVIVAKTVTKQITKIVTNSRIALKRVGNFIFN